MTKNVIFFALVATASLVFQNSWAQSKKSRVSFIDPNSDQVVSVYSSDKKTVVTRLLPGQLISLSPARADGWIPVRAQDVDGKEIELLLDPKVAKPAKDGSVLLYNASPRDRIVNAEFGEGLRVSATPNPGDSEITCLIDQNCQALADGQRLNVEDVVIRPHTDEQTTVTKWAPVYKTEKGWVNGNNIAPVQNSATPSKEDCPPDTPNKKNEVVDNKKNLADVTAMKTKVSELATNQQLDKILPEVGECKPYTEQWNQYEKKIIPSIHQKFYSGSLPKLKKEVLEGTKLNTKDADVSDWIAIDLMARTLYGEMASCFKKGDQYPKTVAKVVANRAEFVNDPKNSKRRSLFVKETPSETKNDITNAILYPKQFSMWNPGDPAGKVAMCPPVSTNQRAYINGRKVSTVEVEIWKKAVKIASDVVLRGPTFKKATQDMKSLYYTSNLDVEEYSSRGFRLQTNASIGGEPVRNSVCLQMWKAKDVAWTPKEDDSL